MIRGAVQIFGEIPASYLNPFSLAESQQEETQGYIVIGYHPEQAAKSYDLLFLRGSTVYECVTLDELHRERTHMDVARARFASSIQHDRTLIYLFQAEETLTQQFISTLFTEPIIKIRVDALSKKQIQSLLRSANFQRALAERNDFSQLLPSIEFLDIDTPSAGLPFRLSFKQGGFLVYPRKESATPLSAHLLEPPLIQVPDQSTCESKPAAHDPVQTADEFAAFLQNFLGAAPLHNKETIRTPPVSHSARSRTSRLRRHRAAENTNPSLSPVRPVEHFDRPTESYGPPNTSAPVTVVSLPEGDQMEITRHFGRLLRSFRQQAFECLGQKAESLIAQAEHSVQLLNPEFSIGTVGGSTAPLVLDLIEEVIKEAPILKRTKLRAVAITLVADLYNKQFDLLEKHNVIDRVEQVYYRMKK